MLLTSRTGSKIFMNFLKLNNRFLIIGKLLLSGRISGIIVVNGSRVQDRAWADCHSVPTVVLMLVALTRTPVLVLSTRVASRGGTNADSDPQHWFRRRPNLSENHCKLWKLWKRSCILFVGLEGLVTCPFCPYQTIMENENDRVSILERNFFPRSFLNRRLEYSPT